MFKKVIKGAAKNTYNYRGLIKQLVIRDLKLKYRRSILGYFWSVMNPLLTMLVLTIVFSHMFRFDIKNFPVYLLCGSIIFGFFSTTTQRCCRAVLENAALIKKVYLPKYIFVFSRVTSGFVDFLLSLIALVLVLIITKTKITLNTLLFIVPCLEVYLFSLGMGLFLAQANVFFRDVQYIYSVFCTALNYLSVIFYPVEALPDNVRFFVENFNPLYVYITLFRQSILFDVALDPNLILKGFIFDIGVLLFGIICFKKAQNKFILYI